MSLLGIDVGTSVCKAAVFSVEGHCLALAQREYDITHPLSGQAELSIRAVWSKVQEIVAQIAASTSHDPVTALSVSSMGEAVVPVTHDRQILADSIMCFDPRGLTYSEALRNEMSAEEFFDINANLVGPNFTMPKLMWIRDHQPALFERADHFLPVSECIAFLLGGEPCFSESQACRTLLFDVYTGSWSPRMLAWSGLPVDKLARVVSAGTVLGTVSPTLAHSLGLSSGVSIVAGGHDQCPTALGCGCIREGMASCGLGTFQCIAPIFAMPNDPLKLFRVGLNIENHVLPGLYLAFLYNQAGSLVKWFRDTFASEQRDDPGIYRRLNMELPSEPTDILVLPHFEPPVWPEYLPHSAGAILGLHTNTTRGEVLKAIMECSSLYLLPGVEALAQVGQPLTSLVAVGGGASSDAWVQINADIFGIPVLRPTHPEAGLVGAAMLAGLATGIFRSPEEATQKMVRIDRRFDPDPARHEFYRAKSQRLSKVYPAISKLLS